MINISDLEFSYEGNSPILKIDSLKIENEEHCFLYGPSGSGKSTLLNLLSGILPVQSGSIEVANQKLETLSSSKRDRFRGENLGIIFQSFNLIPYLNVIDNLLLPSRLYHKRRYTEIKNIAEQYLKRFSLDQHANQQVTNLSVGQRQRVAAIRSFLTFPKLIIADEPTSSLDNKNTEIFMQMLFELVELIQEKESFRPTILFVSHDDRLQKYFNRSISLNDINQCTITEIKETH